MPGTLGTRIAPRPPHRSRRAVFPHRALHEHTRSSPAGRFALGGPPFVRPQVSFVGFVFVSAPSKRVGSESSELPRRTMNRSESLRVHRELFLALSFTTGLVLAIRTPGDRRASQVSANSLLTCHALRRRQTLRSLTFRGSFSFGCGDVNILPVCGLSAVSTLNCLNEERPSSAARKVPCVCFSKVVRFDAPSSGASSSPSPEQHSVSADWLGLCIQFFQIGRAHV